MPLYPADTYQCSGCGTNVQPQDKTCPKCGSKIARSSDEQGTTATERLAPEIPGFTIDQMRAEQNFTAAVAAGAGAALVGAIAWAMVTLVTHYQIGWMALGVGFFVGWSVRQAGKGIDQIFGLAGAVLALLGCAAGNVLTVAALVSQQQTVPVLEVLLQISPEIAVQILADTFSFFDLIFYGIAAYEGYRFSFRRVTEGDRMMMGSSNDNRFLF
jgi:hypothetical protein